VNPELSSDQGTLALGSLFRFIRCRTETTTARPSWSAAVLHPITPPEGTLTRAPRLSGDRSLTLSRPIHASIRARQHVRLQPSDASAPTLLPLPGQACWDTPGGTPALRGGATRTQLVTLSEAGR